jgi:hypothetical protein
MLEGAFSWCGVGMCHKNTIIKNDYGFPYSTIGHGSYLISTNGGTWSNIDADKNAIVNTFSFTLDDTIICTYDPE